MLTVIRGFSSVGVAFALTLVVSACGVGSGKHTSSGSSAMAPGVAVQVGDMSITRSSYDHWMLIGAATRNIPVPGRPLPRPVAYEPPNFAACIANLEQSVPKPHATTTQLKATCQQIYTGIQARILNFLITGYWLRGEAAERGASASEAEVRKKFEEEKRAHYPTAASFRKLQEASRQTIPDLMFAVETQMLSARLLEKFTKAQPKGKSEQATIAAFNTNLKSKWMAKTDCQPGYVISDCKQYKP